MITMFLAFLVHLRQLAVDVAAVGMLRGAGEFFIGAAHANGCMEVGFFFSFMVLFIALEWKALKDAGEDSNVQMCSNAKKSENG